MELKTKFANVTDMDGMEMINLCKAMESRGFYFKKMLENNIAMFQEPTEEEKKLIEKGYLTVY